MRAYIHHYRLVDHPSWDIPVNGHVLRELKAGGIRPKGKGGYTLVQLAVNGQTATGIAKCRSDENFSRKIGRTIALGKAMKKLGYDKVFTAA